MKRMFRLGCVIGIIGVCSAIAVANNQNNGDEYQITIAPNVLVLSSPVPCVTVHSNVPASLVDFSSVALDGVTPYLVKADNLGHLVAKFHTEDIAAIVEPGTVTLTLTGTADGVPFALPDSIKVK